MSLYQQYPGGPWWVSITRDGDRVRRPTGTFDKTEARRKEDEIKAELWKTTPKLKGKTWSLAVEKWKAKEQRSDSELSSLDKFGRGFSDRLLTSVTREDIHAALSFCKTAGTYTRYRTMIQAILNVAKDEGWLREIPKLATRSDKKTKSREWITHEQWDKLYVELPVHLRGPAKFAVSTGLRQSNVLGLRWDSVDLARKLATVDAQDTKAGKALAVPLNDDAVEVLTLLRVRGKGSEWVFTFRGKPFKEIKTAFMAACIRAGVGRATKTGYVGFTWHGLRHTWATWHIQNGTPLDVLMRLGGWSDMRMVLHYAQHTPGYLAGFANNVRKK
jgi:integrase